MNETRGLEAKTEQIKKIETQMEALMKIARYLKYLDDFRYKQAIVLKKTFQRKEKLLFSVQN